MKKDLTKFKLSVILRFKIVNKLAERKTKMNRKQETLMTIFKANPAKELFYTDILYIIMNAKKTTNPADVDQVSLIETLQSLVKDGKVMNWTKQVKNNVDAFEWDTLPVWVYINA